MDTMHEKQNTANAVMASTKTPVFEFPFGACELEGPLDPCMIVIFGASGDLTARKLVPALYNLFLKNYLPDPFIIVGCSRTKLTDHDFRSKMKEAVLGNADIDPSQWTRFEDSLYYRFLQYDDLTSFVDLDTCLRELDRQYRTRENRIFYLAIPPSLYETTAQLLGKAGLSSEKDNWRGWARIVVEKPFGRDLDTAVKLDRSIHENFEEHQIFRIDHYLAKETVQNILIFRFANSIFEPIWNRRYIDHVSITASEIVGVEHRAGYYEQAGILRDMFQNHMMQLLALIAMDPPSRFEADLVRDEKVRVYRCLRPFPVENLQDYLVLGQYGSGTIDGKKVIAYRDEPGVNPDSLTPTYASMKIFLDNWRWQGVPFVLTSGKRLAKKLTEIAIQFKEVPHSMFRYTIGETITANRLILGIYPDEKITMTFQTKHPGPRICLRSVTMDFHYLQNYNGPVLDAYEKVLIDCILGDQMLFWRQDGVELCWSFLTPILCESETCKGRAEALHFYESGSLGPPRFQNGPNFCRGHTG